MSNQNWTRVNPLYSWMAFGWAYGSIALVIWLSEKYSNPWIYVLAVFFISARQHTLYVLNHDASHGNLFNSREWNKWGSSLFCVFPFFHHPEAFSYVLWRRIHVLHHGKLFSDGDPNYVGRRKRGDTSTPMNREKILRNLLKAPVENLKNYIGLQDYLKGTDTHWRGEKVSHPGLLFNSIKHDPEMENERRAKLLFYLVLAGIFSLLGAWKIILLYWMVPMLTVYPSILRLMDLTEHNWHVKTGQLKDECNSRKVNLFTFLFVSDLFRQLHWEHHLNPRVPFFRLPGYSKHLHNTEQQKTNLLSGFGVVK